MAIIAEGSSFKDGKKIAKTSRDDHWPSWNDIPDKPSNFTPSAHKSTHATGGSDALTPYDIGAVSSSDVVSTPTANKILKLDSNGKLPASITGNADGNAATASKLQTARTISLSGDVSGSASFDGSTNATINATLANSGVTAGTYTKVTVDSKGRVTSGTNITSSDITDAASSNTANTLVKRDASGNFTAGTITATLNGNASTASKLQTAKTITLSGDVTGSTSFDGSSNVTITTTVVNAANADTVDNKHVDNTKTDSTALWTADKIISYIGSAGYGDMMKGTYDTDNDGIVDRAETADKLTTARTISLVGDVSGSTSFDGSVDKSITVTLSNSGVTAGTYPKVTVDAKGRVTSGTSLSATDIPSLDMSKITTGNLDTTRLSEPSYVTGSVTITAKPLFDVPRADRTAFLPASQIIIEKSTDAGATWVDAGISDTVKARLFTGQKPTILIPLKNGQKNTDCMLRITITGMKYNVPQGTAETEKYNYWNSSYVTATERYFAAEDAWLWVSSNADRIYCKVERATGANPNSWVLVREAFMSGWSGGNYIKLDGNTFGGGTSQTSNYWNWRFTFRTATTSNDFDNAKLNQTYITSTQAIYHIKISGRNVWVAPNKLMYHDHIYSWDENQNVTFPADVKANNFYIGSNKVWHAGNLVVSTTPPSNPQIGDIWIDIS